MATAEVVQRGRRLAHADCAVTVGDRLVGTARAVFAVFDRGSGPVGRTAGR